MITLEGKRVNWEVQDTFVSAFIDDYLLEHYDDTIEGWEQHCHTLALIKEAVNMLTGEAFVPYYYELDSVIEFNTRGVGKKVLRELIQERGKVYDTANVDYCYV